MQLMTAIFSVIPLVKIECKITATAVIHSERNIAAGCATRVPVQDYSLSMYLRQKWLDSRLSFDRAANHNSSMLKLEDNAWNRIWIPEVVFRNEKEATFHDVSTANRMMRLHDTGYVWYVSK